MKPNYIMVDLETMGTKPNSAIIAIGAKRLYSDDTFYTAIPLSSSVEYGLRMDPGTVLWWMRQSDNARAALADPPKSEPLPAALLHFADWAVGTEGAGDVVLWGNGAAFDNVLLAHAFETTQLTKPWAFWNDRCYRTMKSLFPTVPFTAPEIPHHALHDAIAQANHLEAILDHIAKLYGGKPLD